MTLQSMSMHNKCKRTQTNTHTHTPVIWFFLKQTFFHFKIFMFDAYVSFFISDFIYMAYPF